MGDSPYGNRRPYDEGRTITLSYPVPILLWVAVLWELCAIRNFPKNVLASSVCF